MMLESLVTGGNVTVEPIGVIRSEDLEQALSVDPRQYLMGNLQQPQVLKHLHSDDIEVGMVIYPHAAADEPHEHPQVHECQLVLEGRLKLLNLDTYEEVSLSKGDFYSVPSDTAHVQKAVAGTKVFFFKHPAMNDKTPVSYGADVETWLSDLEF